MFRVIFWLFFVAYLAGFSKGQYDEIVFETEEEYKCPNDKCSESDKVELINNLFDIKCCKLIGIHNELIEPKVRYNSYGGYRGIRESLGLLIIENGEIRRIPEKLFTNFQPIILRIIRSGLPTLKIDDFSGAARLKQLNITYNNIENLEPNVFIYAPNIEIIDLSNNRIAQVSEYSFENILQLKVLILSNNLIKEIYFKSNLVNLAIFMIGNNSLSHLNENVFQNSTHLTELCINKNLLNISKLQIDTVLEVFDMSDNPSSIYLTSKNLIIKNSNAIVLNIDGMTTTIDASGNQINSIVVDPKNNLTVLNLSKNNLTTIQNLTGLTSIQKLDLSFNNIQDINLTTFSSMSDLEELNLENSGLSHIDFGTFSHQKRLSWLDISYNNLKEINLNKLTNSLQYLYIEGNELTNTDLADINAILPHLLAIGLSNNRFSCEKLAEIRKILSASFITMYVDATLIVKNATNINGIGCLNENSTEKLEFRSTKLLPIHSNASAQNTMIETIEGKIKEIEKNILQHNKSLTENSINSRYDISSMKQDIMNVENDIDVKLIDAKSDILMTISRLLNVSTNGSDVNFELKTTIEEVNAINLERYKSLSSQLKLVKDKLEDLIENVENLKNSEKSENFNVKNVQLLKHNSQTVSDNSNVDLISLKNMMTFIIVTIILLIFGFVLSLIYKRYSKRRRYISTNTINTNVEQSLV